MAWLKTQPDVRLMLPRPLIAGQLAEFIVELDCPKPVPVDVVSLTLFGEIVWFTTGQHGRHRNASRFLGHRVALTSETELPAGKHRLPTRMRLSDELPASWTGDRLAVEYGVEVHVDIPWWPDKRAQFVVRVADRGTPRADDGPMVIVSELGGPPAKGPYLEVALGQPSVHPGGQLRLSAALGNVGRNQYRKLDIQLLARESFPTGLGGHHVNDHPVAGWSVGVDQHPGELRPIPFTLALPSSLVPSFEMHGCSLVWLLQVTADVAWGVDPELRIPLVVQPSGELGEARIAAPLAVGSDRLRLLWSKLAREAGLELVDDRMHGARGRVRVDVHRDDEGGSPRVIGLLEFPELGVGLRRRTGRLTLLGGGDTPLSCRDAEHDRMIGESLGRPIAASDYQLVDAGDQRLVLALAGPGADAGPLARFVAWLLEIADALDGLPPRLPVPARMAEHAAAWTRAAKALAATLRPADMSLTIERDGMQLIVGCVYDSDGQLRATRFELDPKLTIPTRQQLLWTGDTALPEHELELEHLVTPPAWTDERRVALHIEPTRVRVLLPAPLPDPLLERGRVEALLGLGRHLRGEQGPYR